MAGSTRRRTWSLAVLLVATTAGLVFAAAHATSAGEDLRPAGGDVASLVVERSQRVEQRKAEAEALQQEIDDALAGIGGGRAVDDLAQRLAQLRDVAGLSVARGPGVTVTLTDAPRGSAPSDIDPNYLVVHQQDIQAFVNALWAGGAEAVSLQGQRLISTSAIICVGSTVVIDGRPYSPPYVIEAVGDVPGMTYSLAVSPEIVNYERYVRQYDLGLRVQRSDDVLLDAYDGTVELQHARPLD